MTRKHTDCAGICLGVFLLMGCGGASVTGSSASPLSQITLSLPVESRAPNPDHVGSVHLVFVAGSQSGADVNWTVDAPPNPVTTLMTQPPVPIKPGEGRLKVEFRSGAHGTGSIVGTLEIPTIIKDDGTILRYLPIGNQAAPLEVLSVAPEASTYLQGFEFVTGPVPAGDTFKVEKRTLLQGQGIMTTSFAVPDRLVTYAIVSGADVASVSSDGTITGLKEGSATVSITIKGQVFSQPVYVGPPNVAFSHILARNATGLVWEEDRNILWASMAASDSAAQSVAAIDPTSGNILRTIPVGGVASAVSLSENGQTLWVGMDGTPSVRKISLPSESVGPPIVTTLPGFTGRVGQIAIDPNDEDRIAVVLHSPTQEPAIIVVDHGAVVSINAPRGYFTAAWSPGGQMLASGYRPITFDSNGFSPDNIGPGPGTAAERATKATQYGTKLLYSTGAYFSTQTLSVIHDFARDQALPYGTAASVANDTTFTVMDLEKTVGYWSGESRPHNVSIGAQVRVFRLSTGETLGKFALPMPAPYFLWEGWSRTPVPFPTIVPVGTKGFALCGPTGIYILNNAPGL